MSWVGVVEEAFQVPGIEGLAEEVLNLVDCLVTLLKEMDCYVVRFEDADGRHYMVVPAEGTLEVTGYGRVLGGVLTLNDSSDVRGLVVGLTVYSREAGVVRIDGSVVCVEGKCKVEYTNELVDVDYSCTIEEREWEALVRRYYEERGWRIPGGGVNE